MARLKIARFWDADKFLSISAMLISVGTFATFIYQTNLIQKQQYASVLPYLEIWNSGADSTRYKLLLVNNGIGPAFIKDIKIHYKGKTYPYDPIVFYSEVIYPSDTISFISTNVNKGQVVPAGERIEIVIVNNSVKDAAKLRQLFGNQTAKLDIVYSSVYEEKWRLDGMGKAPVKLDD
ncbi:hypothetical protein GXP67_34505 [Rhodocytophaga rosea]|uniref:Uncharacterized protein n=1 Tax=Rhodocytophaga rosea TaxID=2704465 RepID=A0A6C0GTB9_9BACT|nr:hypothetical protein [Rhodocytophaga rosea]QHT71409.1 hypothetical protein GXP67_34505 [Rhodocytophaga rosea]